MACRRVWKCIERACRALQGTAAVTLAGLYAAMLAQGQPMADITKQRYVVVGAGSAGTGIADMAAEAMAKQVPCAMHGLRRLCVGVCLSESLPMRAPEGAACAALTCNRQASKVRLRWPLCAPAAP